MRDKNHCGLLQFGACDQCLDVCQDAFEYVHFERTEKMVSVSPGLVNSLRRFVLSFHYTVCVCVCVCIHTHTHTHILTPWSRALLEKLIGVQLVKKFPAFYGTRRFITAFTSASCKWYVTGYALRWGVVSTSPNPPKLEDHPLSAVRDCLFNIFVATFHTGGHTSIRNLGTRHAVVTRTH